PPLCRARPPSPVRTDPPALTEHGCLLGPLLCGTIWRLRRNPPAYGTAGQASTVRLHPPYPPRPLLWKHRFPPGDSKCPMPLGTSPHRRHLLSLSHPS